MAKSNVSVVYYSPLEYDNIQILHQDELKMNVCALLNSGGGKLDLTNDDADMVIAAKEDIQWCIEHFKTIVGPLDVHKCFKISEPQDNRVTLNVSGLPTLCTLKTHLYIPTLCQMEMVGPREQDALQEILGHRVFETSKHEIPTQFRFDDKCSINKSKTVRFENPRRVKSDSNLEIILKKLPIYVSGFANGLGGMIFYGIKDDATVEGYLLSDNEKDVQAISEKVNKVVQNMIWPEGSETVLRGKQWDIDFIPVVNCDVNEKRFVIVVSVFPCSGGVFTEEPESYYVEDDVVKKMSFETWKTEVLQRPRRNANIPDYCS